MLYLTVVIEGQTAAKATEEFVTRVHSLGYVTDMTVSSSDSTIWFLTSDPMNGNALGAIFVDGRIETQPLASRGAAGDIDIGPDHAVWFAAGQYTLGHMVPGGPIQLFGTTDEIYGVASAADGTAWVTAPFADALIHFGPDGHVLGRVALTAGAHPVHVVISETGDRWFSEPAVGSVGRLSDNGSIREFQIGAVKNLAIGPDDFIWCTLPDRGMLAVIQPDLEVFFFPISEPENELNGVAVGKDGVRWYTERGTGLVRRDALDGQLQDIRVDGAPGVIAVNDRGSAWVADSISGDVFEIVPLRLLHCAGDCAPRDGVVTVNEIIRCIGAVLAPSSELDTCSSCDADGDGTVSVADIVSAVQTALVGCVPSGEPGNKAAATR